LEIGNKLKEQQPLFDSPADLGERNRELERVAQDLEGEVRQLREQLLHPTGQRGGPPRQPVTDRAQRQHVGHLEADLQAVLHEKDLQRSRIRDLEANMRHLKVGGQCSHRKPCRPEDSGGTLYGCLHFWLPGPVEKRSYDVKQDRYSKNASVSWFVMF